MGSLVLFHEVNGSAGWNAERKTCFAVRVGDRQIAAGEYIHAQDAIFFRVVNKLGRHSGEADAVWQININDVHFPAAQEGFLNAECGYNAFADLCDRLACVDQSDVRG